MIVFTSGALLDSIRLIRTKNKRKWPVDKIQNLNTVYGISKIQLLLNISLGVKACKNFNRYIVTLSLLPLCCKCIHFFCFNFYYSVEITELFRSKFQAYPRTHLLVFELLKS